VLEHGRYAIAFAIRRARVDVHREGERRCPSAPL